MMYKLKIKNLIFLITVLCCSILSCCSADKDNSEVSTNRISSSEISRPSEVLNYDDDFTLMIYMCGSSLESRNGSASDDISELLSADIPDKVNVLIETGGSQRWKKHSISADKLQRYTVENNKLKLLEDIKLSNMGDSQTLKDFIDWGTENFPAKRTALILWDHGGGVLNGICKDELYQNNWLTIQEFDDALSKSKFQYSFDFIGFDACLMANYETTLVASKYSDYMIASEDLEPTGGWDYKALSEALGSDRLYDIILDSYQNYHKNNDYYTLSAINLKMIDRVKNLLLQCISKTEKNNNPLLMSEAVQSSEGFGSVSSYLYDLGNIADYIGIDYNCTDIVKSVHSENRKNTCGINFCFPQNDSEALNKYLQISKDEKYNAFLKKYFRRCLL